MSVKYELLLKNLEQELEFESEAEGEDEAELFAPAASPLPAAPLRSLRFSDDHDLQAVALGRVRLGRANDSPYPAPILSQGRPVRKVQQALLDLGFSLPLYGDDSNYGQETYQAVLAFKRRFNILTTGGLLDGIVGPKTITRLDSHFPPGPLPACSARGGSVVSAEAESENFDSPSNVNTPWVNCDPLLEPGPFSSCDKSLPDHGNLATEGVGALAAPGIGQFYCINKPRIHLEFTATWEEMVHGAPLRSPNAPKYDVQLAGYREENFVPGRSYVRDITVTAPEIGSLHFLTSLQRNRIFRVTFSIQES